MSANKRKGDAFEREVAEVFRTHGHPNAERMLRLGAHRDDGDIANVAGMHIDAKAHKRFELGTWLDEVKRECGDLVPVVVVKRPRVADAARAYAVLELADFADLIAEAERYRRELREVRDAQ
jgi:hypothetical protein